MVSEHRRSEMRPPTVTQRVELIEEKLTNLEGKISELVSKAVERAVEAMHHSLSEMLLEGQTKVSKQLRADLDALAGRLEGRVQRTREFHESLINSMKNDQMKFQSEIRSAVIGGQGSQIPPNHKPEGSVNQGGLSPSSMTVFVGTEGMGQGIGGSGEIFEGGGYGSFGNYNGGNGTIHGGIMGGGIGGGNLSGGMGNMGEWRYRKLDMPIFEGTDPDGWILRIERYFSFYRLTETEKLEAVVVGLEGDALRWFQWENKRRPIRRWDELREFC